MGTGNTILYWYGACIMFVLVTTAIVAALVVVGRRRKSVRYRTRALEPLPSDPPAEGPLD